MKSVDRILGEAVRPPTLGELTNPGQAYFYAKNVLEDRFPLGEPAISKDPEYACLYAANAIGGRFPMAEATIAKDPQCAQYYAKWVIKGRWPEGESTIANSVHKSEYLKLFPDAAEEWAMNGWLDWMDT